MGWPFNSRVAQITADDMLGWRTARRSSSKSHSVRRDEALRSSAAWACLRLRADLISTLPVDTYRTALIEGEKLQIEVPPPPVLQAPGGAKCEYSEFMYSSQFDLDSCGNTVGLIKARDGLGLPAIIELSPIDEVSVRVKSGDLTYRIAGEEFTPDKIWHEKQFTMSGLPVGLSPIAYAATSLGGYLSAQEFATDWFNNSAVPASWLRNKAKTLSGDEATSVKARFKASIEAGDVFVTGNDWEYQMLAAKASESQFLETMRFGIADICRFLGVPGDMIDAETATGSITYANITQRNLQLLIMNIGPAIVRREKALSKWLPQPRFVKINTDALLRMDLASRYASYAIAIQNRFMVPDEARQLENNAPLTSDQVAQFAQLFPKTSTMPGQPPVGVQ